MFPLVISRTLNPLRQLVVVQTSQLHCSAPCLAAVKKTTSAAGAIEMFPLVISRTLNPLRQLVVVQTSQLHCSAPCLAAVKKTTSAAGGVMGLGKGKKKGGKLTTMEKKEMTVETDPHKLVHFVCGSNIYTTGEDVKIKEDSEYPEWLWSLNVGRAAALEQLDPGSKRYWLRVRAAAMRRNNKLRSMRNF